MESRSKSFRSYLKTAAIIIIAIPVGILVIAAILSRATLGDYVWMIGTGVFLIIIASIAGCFSKRRNK